jgi:23S rRNA pseudouridine1911/1915/1917 synthase
MKKISELILFKDHHLMAFNKPAGLLSQEDPSGDIHAHRMAMAYAHRDLFVVHRLDRRVSGVLVFAKTKTAAAALSKQWEERKVKKNYLGIVPIADVPHNAQLQHYLTYDQKQNITIVHQSPVPGADEAILHYQVLQQFENFMLLRIDLISGRKHQIRAQLSAAGIPIRGDIKYGSKRTNPDGAIDLHSFTLQFQHPSRQEYIKIKAPVPEESLWKHIDPELIKTI